MGVEVIYFEKFCKNCGCNKTFKRSTYPNGKTHQRCIDCARKSCSKSASKPEAKENRKEYRQKRLQQLHEAGIVKPRQTPVIQAVHNESGLKRCNKCFEFKEETKCFVSRGRGKYTTTCKVCKNKQTLANLKANQDRLEKKREYDRARVKTVAKAANLVSTRRYQEKLKPIRQQKSLERQLLKGLSCKAHWYKCKHCSEFVYSKGILIDTCRKHVKIGYKLKDKEVVCRVCNSIYIGKNNNATCPVCREELKMQTDKKNRRIHKHIRRFRQKYNGLCEKVDPLKVFERDKFKCKLCGVKVQKQDVYASNAAELDHIIPLSKGGAHAYYNCQTLCRCCNQAKSNKLLGQLLIPI